MKERSLYSEEVPKVSDNYAAARRDQILAAAAVRFAREGFHRASMQDVIDEAGLSPGAVYRYFRSKDEIIAAIALRSMGMIEATVRESLETHRPLTEVVAELPRAFSTLDHAEESMRLAVQAWGESLRNPALAATMQSALNQVREALQQRITQGQIDGEVDPAVNPDHAARILLALVQGFLLQHTWEPTLDADDYGRAASDVLRGHLNKRHWAGEPSTIGSASTHTASSSSSSAD